MSVRVGRFELDERVASGGSAEVYRARDPLTGREIALKRLRIDRDDATARARFEREARILSELDHPNVVTYVAHGVDDEGRLYLATEWLAGETVEAAIERERPGDWSALRMLQESAFGLAALHAVGVIHRDVKPANLFLAASPEGAVVKVIDLGIAVGEGDLALTRAGTVVGSPYYIAPEQLRGEEPSPASDLYALAVVFFELLTGFRPFQGVDTRTVLQRIARDAPPRLRELRPDLPAALEALLDRALSKDPSRRPVGVVEFVEEVSAVLELVTTRPDGVPEASLLARSEQRVRVVALVRAAHDGARGLLADAAARLAERGAGIDRDGEHGIRAVFGDHRLRGDEAVRAVRAAAEVRGRGLRVVVVTGLTRRLGDALDGPALSRAATLLSATSEGELLVDAATAVALGGRFETEARRDGQRVGRDLERLHSAAPRSLLYDEGTLPGRDEALDFLLAQVRDAWAQRRPRVLVVKGEAGVGKSTLAREVISRLLGDRALDVEPSAAPLLTLRGDLLANHTPLGAVGRALRERAGIQEGATPEAQRARLEHLVDGALDETSLGFLADIARVPLRAEGSVLRAARRDPDLFRDGLLRSLLGLIRATNASSPALLLLEDAQWIDGSTLEVVASILDALPSAALVVLALPRPEPESLARLGRIWSAHPRVDLALPPLAPSVVQSLAARGLGALDDPRLRSDLAARCGGNPLFLEELLGLVREAAARDPGLGPRVELPTAALSAVQLRLDGLDPEARRIVRAASVFGSVFWRDGLASLVGASPEAQLDRPLRVLSAHGFVSPAPSSRVAGTVEYAFRHDLVRDAAYATLLDDDRRALHARVAAWLSARERTDPALIARHHDLAGQPELARAWWLRAARAALRDQAFHAALEHATRALAGSPPPDERRETLCVRADASFALADSATALDDARAAESIPGATAAQRLRVALCVANGQTLQGRIDAGLAVLQVACARAAAIARGPGDDEVPPALWLSATLRQAHLMTQRGIARDALDLARGAMNDARTPRADRDAARSLADAVVGSALLGLQRLEEARDACEQALDRSQRDGDLPRMFQSAIAEGRVLTRLGDHARAVQRLERARDDAGRLGMALYETIALQHLGVALARRGDGAEALRVEARALTLATRHGLARIATRSRVYTAWIEGFDPRVPDAEASLRWLGMSTDEGRGDAPLRCLLRAAHARLLLLHRDGDGALALAKEAVGLLDAGVTLEDGDVFVRWVYADALAKLGRRGEADDAYVRAWSRVNALLANIGDDARRKRCREGALEHRALADTIVARGLPTINVTG